MPIFSKRTHEKMKKKSWWNLLKPEKKLGLFETQSDVKTNKLHLIYPETLVGEAFPSKSKIRWILKYMTHSCRKRQVLAQKKNGEQKKSRHKQHIALGTLISELANKIHMITFKSDTWSHGRCQHLFCRLLLLGQPTSRQKARLARGHVQSFSV